jgi:class 3 adenylate cyclase
MAATEDIEARRRGQGVPLSVTLATSIGVLMVFAVGAVLLISWLAGRKNTLDLLNEKAISIVETIETGIRNHLDPAVAQLGFIERLIASGALHPSDQEHFADTMLGALAAAPQISAVLYYDRDLRELMAFQDPAGPVGIERADASGSDLVRRISEQIREAQAAFRGDVVYAPDSGATYVNLRQPIRLDGAYLGFLVAAVSMPELSELVTHVGDAFDATAFILLGESKVLAHPNLMSPHPDLAEDSPAVAIDRVGDMVLQDMTFGSHARGFDEAAAEGVQVAVVRVGAEDHVSFTRRIDRYGAEPWIVGAHVPASFVDTELQRLVRAGIAGLFVLLLSLAAAVLLGRHIAKPIRRLASRASQVGRLELATVPDLPRSWIRELNEQAHSFNAMLKGLRWFETYVPKKLVQRLIRSERDAPTASAERELTIMFTDIVGYTPLSERMTPSETEAFLNEHFALLATCIEGEGGTIDKFIGDAVMAFWGAPDAQPDHATRACRAARAITAAVEADNERRRQDGLPAVRVRIGIHTDRVVVGNIGATGRMNYTIVGDGVNTGQRLEALGKELDDGRDVTTLVSAATAQAADRGQIQLEPAGQFHLKGKDLPLEVFRLTSERLEA